MHAGRRSNQSMLDGFKITAFNVERVDGAVQLALVDNHGPSKHGAQKANLDRLSVLWGWVDGKVVRSWRGRLRDGPCGSFVGRATAALGRVGGKPAGDTADDSGSLEAEVAQVEDDGDQDVVFGADEQVGVCRSVVEPIAGWVGEAGQQASFEQDGGGGIGGGQCEGKEARLVEHESSHQTGTQHGSGGVVRGLGVVGGAMDDAQGGIDLGTNAMFVQGSKGAGLQLSDGGWWRSAGRGATVRGGGASGSSADGAVGVFGDEGETITLESTGDLFATAARDENVV